MLSGHFLLTKAVTKTASENRLTETVFVSSLPQLKIKPTQVQLGAIDSFKYKYNSYDFLLTPTLSPNRAGGLSPSPDPPPLSAMRSS